MEVNNSGFYNLKQNNEETTETQLSEDETSALLQKMIEEWNETMVEKL